jgi:hypothetical protein
MAHTMDGIIVGWSPTSNALLVFDPCNCQYYKPDSYPIDSYRLPGLVYPTLKYDGDIFCSLLPNGNPLFGEEYPPGTRVEHSNPTTNMLLAKNVMDIPFPLDQSGEASLHNYTVLFNYGMMASIPLEDMASIILPPPINAEDSNSTSSLLTGFDPVCYIILWEYPQNYLFSVFFLN